MTYTIEKVPLSVKQLIIHLLNQVVKLPLPLQVRRERGKK